MNNKPVSTSSVVSNSSAAEPVATTPVAPVFAVRNAVSVSVKTGVRAGQEQNDKRA